MRQTLGTQVSKDQWANYHADNPSDPNYSIIDTLDDSFKIGGKFVFKMVWPNNKLQTNIWRQSENPFRTPIAQKKSQDELGYTAEEIDSNTGHWGGLQRGEESNCLMDGSTKKPDFWHSIGCDMAELKKATGWAKPLPGPNNEEATMVELYVAKKFRSQAAKDATNGFELVADKRSTRKGHWINKYITPAACAKEIARRPECDQTYFEVAKYNDYNCFCVDKNVDAEKDNSEYDAVSIYKRIPTPKPATAEDGFERVVHGKNCKLGRWLDIYDKTPLQCKKLIEKESNQCDPTWFASRQGPNPSDLGDRNCFCAQKDSNCGQPSEQVDDPAVSIFKISPPPPKTGTQIRSCRSRDRSKQVDAKLSGVKWCVDVTDSWTHEQLNQCAQQQGNEGHEDLCPAKKEIPCNEQLTGTAGSEYRGCQTTTRSGKTCQKWTSTNPHDTTKLFANQKTSNSDYGIGDHNFCRNPSQVVEQCEDKLGDSVDPDNYAVKFYDGWNCENYNPMFCKYWGDTNNLNTGTPRDKCCSCGGGWKTQGTINKVFKKDTIWCYVDSDSEELDATTNQPIAWEYCNPMGMGSDLERVGVTLSLDLKNSVTRERVMPAEGVANMIVSDMEKSLDLLDNN